MYRRMISGMLAVAMTFQMCAGTVHAVGNAKQVTSQPAGTELFVMQEQAEEMAAVESAADFMPETSTETNKETSAEENTEGNADAANDKNTDTTIDENTETSIEASTETVTAETTEPATDLSTEAETESTQENGTESMPPEQPVDAAFAESKTLTASVSTLQTEDSEEEAYEEGNPDFMFQAGGFQVMDSSGDGRIRMYGADEDRAKLLAQEDLDQLASELYTALKNRETTIEVRDYAFYNDKPEDTQQLLMMYYAVVNDHPDLYYVRT